MGRDKTSILFMQDNGKVRQLRTSSKSIRNLVIFAIFFSVLFLISNYGFFSLLRDTIKTKERNEQMVKEVGLVKRKIKKVKSALRDAKRKLALEQAMAKEPKEMEPGAKMSKEEIKESEKKVGVRDFRLADSKDLSRLQVKFTIFNKDSYRSIVNGRIIMVASKETVEPYFYVSYPQTSLKGGEPTNPNTGYRFAIRKFKQIKGHFKRPSMEICFDHVSIFLYSPKGTLILREKFSFDENFCKENKITLSK